MHRARFVAISAVFVLSTAIAGTLALIPFGVPSALAATTCPQNKTPQFNIIYCGLLGTTTAQYISSLQGYYNSNNDGHGNHDIQAVLNWAGATPAMIAGMTTSNTVVGTAFSNGTITVNGQTVGTGSIVAGRWNPGTAGFTHLEGNVWYRNATTSFAPTPSVQVLVHLNSSGQADFAVMIVCGNVLKFTPSTPPKKVLTCDQLTQSEVDTSLEYVFTAKATAQNTTISSYTFNFGDGSKQIVNTSSTTATTNHTYNLNGTTYTANVLVNGSVTSSSCQVMLTTPPVPVTPSLACVQLTSTPVNNSTTSFTFTAQATAVKTSIVSYTFNFGDNVTTTIPTSAETINVAHTYTPGSYKATVTVNGNNNQSATSNACMVQLTVPSPPSTPPATPPVLLNTGPGAIGGIFGAAAIGGALFHHFILRRRFFLTK
jgi:hypothetical protein